MGIVVEVVRWGCKGAAKGKSCKEKPKNAGRKSAKMQRVRVSEQGVWGREMERVGVGVGVGRWGGGRVRRRVVEI